MNLEVIYTKKVGGEEYNLFKTKSEDTYLIRWSNGSVSYLYLNSTGSTYFVKATNFMAGVEVAHFLYKSILLVNEREGLLS